MFIIIKKASLKFQLKQTDIHLSVESERNIFVIFNHLSIYLENNLL